MTDDIAEARVKIKEYIRIANSYSDIEYDFNTVIEKWNGQKAVITIQNQDDLECEQGKVLLSYDGAGFVIEDLDNKWIATTRRPTLVFAILYT